MGGHPLDVSRGLLSNALQPLRAQAALDRLAELAAEWLRVGFCQGNFNADNCLVAGRTMDYGPFGFMDKYDPKFAKWVGSGDHFAFAAQPAAALANFGTLVRALVPLFDDARPLQQISERAKQTFARQAAECYRKKLGFPSVDDAAAAALWKALEPQLRGLDYTIFFRQLAAVAEATDADDLLALVADAQYAAPSPNEARNLNKWLVDWRAALAAQDALHTAPQRLNAANPKFVLREWMLVEAYDAAADGDFSVARDLHDLVKTPYDEHAGAMTEKYYTRAPQAALTRPGTAFMT